MIYDSRIPAKEHCVLAYQLEYWASERPEQIAVIFHGGESWSWAKLLEMTRKTAYALKSLKVGKGDHVLSWQPNNKQALLTWFGLNYLGAVYVPVNTAYKGSLLQHVVQLADASLMICHADLAPRLNDIDTAGLRDIIVTHGKPTLNTLNVLPESLWFRSKACPPFPTW